MADHSNYSFRAMAQDQVEVMAAPRVRPAFSLRAAGHDRGARVLQPQCCLDHPDKIERAAIPWTSYPQALPSTQQHHAAAWATFSPGTGSSTIQPYDMPERMMGGPIPIGSFARSSPRLSRALSFLRPGEAARPNTCGAFAIPKTIHAICEDYRAGATIDKSPWDDADLKGRSARSTARSCCCGGASGRGRPAIHDSMAIWPRLCCGHQGAGRRCHPGHYLSEGGAGGGPIRNCGHSSRPARSRTGARPWSAPHSWAGFGQLFVATVLARGWKLFARGIGGFNGEG